MDAEREWGRERPRGRTQKTLRFCRATFAPIRNSYRNNACKYGQLSPVKIARAPGWSRLMPYVIFLPFSTVVKAAAVVMAASDPFWQIFKRISLIASTLPWFMAQCKIGQPRWWLGNPEELSPDVYRTIFLTSIIYPSIKRKRSNSWKICWSN